MTVRCDVLALAAALCGAALVGQADAAVIGVSWSGRTMADAGGPYTVTGGFVFDTSVPGAATDLSDVAIDDPGISGFMLSITGGLKDQTFTDNTAIAAGRGGSMDLSSFGTFARIVSSSFCLLGAGAVDTDCTRFNPAGFAAFFDSPGVAFVFSPAGDEGSAVAPGMAYRVTDLSSVPVPSSLPLLAAGLGAFGAAVRARRRTPLA